MKKGEPNLQRPPAVVDHILLAGGQSPPGVRVPGLRGATRLILLSHGTLEGL